MVDAAAREHRQMVRTVQAKPPNCHIEPFRAQATNRNRSSTQRQIEGCLRLTLQGRQCRCRCTCARPRYSHGPAIAAKNERQIIARTCIQDSRDNRRPQHVH